MVGVMFAALLSGLTSSVTNVRFGQEHNRATQIMVEKLDTIRMYRWDKINSTYVPENFTVSDTQTYGGQTIPGGTSYAGTITIRTPTMAESYSADVKAVTVRLQWQSGGRPVERQMTTFVSRYGLQKYVP